MASTSIARPALVAAILFGLFAIILPAAAADKPSKKPTASKKAKAAKADASKPDKPKSDEPKSDEPQPDAPPPEPSSILVVTPSKATLRWKFKVGDERRYLVNQKSSMSMNIMGQAVDTKSVQSTLVTWKVVEVHENGGCKMTQKFESIRMKMDGPGGAGEYDSAKGTKLTGLIQSMNQLFDAMLSGEFTQTMSAQGEISEIEMPADLAKALKSAPPGAALTEEGLKQILTQGSPALPDKQVASGDDWSETVEVQAPLVGAMKTITQYTYQGVVQRDGRPLEMISIAPKTQFDGKGLFKPEITSQKCDGALLFDNEAGHLVESRFQQTTEMKMSVMGNDINQTMNQTVAMRQLAEGEEPPADPADKDAAVKPKDADADQTSKEDDAKDGDEDEDKSEDEDEDKSEDEDEDE